MTFRIHFEYPEGNEDSFDVSGNTIEEVRDKANKELALRTHGEIAPVAWSEERKQYIEIPRAVFNRLLIWYQKEEKP